MRRHIGIFCLVLVALLATAASAKKQKKEKSNKNELNEDNGHSNEDNGHSNEDNGHSDELQKKNEDNGHSNENSHSRVKRWYYNYNWYWNGYNYRGCSYYYYSYCYSYYIWRKNQGDDIKIPKRPPPGQDKTRPPKAKGSRGFRGGYFGFPESDPYEPSPVPVLPSPTSSGYRGYEPPALDPAPAYRAYSQPSPYRSYSLPSAYRSYSPPSAYRSYSQPPYHLPPYGFGLG